MQRSHGPYARMLTCIAGAGHGKPMEYPAASDFHPVCAARHYAVLTAMRQQSGEQGRVGQGKADCHMCKQIINQATNANA